MRDKVEFPTNTPVAIVLEFDKGKDVEGRFGDQVMYYVDGGRIMYVPPIVRDQITRLGVGAGQPITVCKQEVKQANRRSIQWLVERLEGQSEAVGEVSNATPTAPTPSPAAVNGPKPPQTITAAARPPEVGSLCGPRGAQLRLALCSAIEAAQAAEDHAKARSYVVRFSADEITRMALTLLIGAQRDGGR